MKAIVWIIIIIILVLGGIFLFSDREDKQDEESLLKLSISGLEALSGSHYEGWAIFGEEKISTGKFNLGDKLEFSSSRDLSDADKIVITIEPDGDTDDVPSGIVLLAGDVANGSASLSFPVDLSMTAGNYILATPTNGDGTDETSGVWFLKLPPPLQAGLLLPQLPGGWVYEGWVVNQGSPITSGRFVSPEGIDGFNGFSGGEAAPPFPGEDYLVSAPNGIVFPIDLADGASKVVISVEPDLNGIDPTGSAPFAVKPLVADVPQGASDHENYQMNQNLSSVPSGTAAISN
jgi:hypothetical protein